MVVVGSLNMFWAEMLNYNIFVCGAGQPTMAGPPNSRSIWWRESEWSRMEMVMLGGTWVASSAVSIDRAAVCQEHCYNTTNSSIFLQTNLDVNTFTSKSISSLDITTDIQNFLTIYVVTHFPYNFLACQFHCFTVCCLLLTLPVLTY